MCRISSVFRGRVPPHAYPAAACFHNAGMIQVEGNHCCPSRRRVPGYLAAIRTPPEVPIPALLARVEQGHDLTCRRVFGLGLRPLELVAGMAGDAEIAVHGLSTRCFGHNVIDHQRRPGREGQRMTVGASIPELCDHGSAKGERRASLSSGTLQFRRRWETMPAPLKKHACVSPCQGQAPSLFTDRVQCLLPARAQRALAVLVQQAAVGSLALG